MIRAYETDADNQNKTRAFLSNEIQALLLKTLNVAQVKARERINTIGLTVPPVARGPVMVGGSSPLGSLTRFRFFLKTR